MHKLKKAAAVAVMVGGIGLVGGGVASAGDGPYPHPVVIDNLQAVECEQAFEAPSSTVPTASITGSVAGDVEQNVGNFCAAAHD